MRSTVDVMGKSVTAPRVSVHTETLKWGTASVVVFIDESQDTDHFVLGAVSASDLVTLNMIVGRIRTTTRNLGLVVQEFHEATLYHSQPKLLTQALKQMVKTRSGKKKALHVRSDVRAYAVSYSKRSEERIGSGLPGERLMEVYTTLFSRLLTAMPLPSTSPDIVYDTFQYAQRLQPALASEVQQAWRTGTIRWGDSRQDKPLQLADLVAGTVRRHLGGEANEDRFLILKPILTLVDE